MRVATFDCKPVARAEPHIAACTGVEPASDRSSFPHKPSLSWRKLTGGFNLLLNSQPFEGHSGYLGLSVDIRTSLTTQDSNLKPTH